MNHQLLMEYSVLPSKGFTIIELIVVLMILIVLGVAVGSKLFSAKTDTNIAVLETMGGAIMSSGRLVYSKAMMQGLHKHARTTIDLDKDGIDDVEIAYGWPSASRGNGVSRIMGDGFEDQWTWSTTYGDTRFWLTTASLGGRSGQYVNQTAVRNSGCYILYDPATSFGDTPDVSYVVDDC